MSTAEMYREAWLSRLRRERKAENTLLKYGEAVGHHARWLGDRDPTSVTRAELEGYRDDWFAERKATLGREPAENTERLMVAAVKSFYGFLELQEHVDRSPAERLGSPKARRRGGIQWLQGGEDEAMLAEAVRGTPQERAVVHLLRWTGLRASEAIALRWADVDMEGGSLFVRDSKTQSGRRHVTVVPELRPELELVRRRAEERGLYAPDAPVLCARGQDGRPAEMAYNNVHRAVTRVAARAGVTATPHTLRRTFGSHLINRGCPLNSVSRALGHSDTSTTERAYADLLPETVRDDVLAALSG